MKTQHAVVMIPGDGIGPEVADACRQVLAATGVSIQWDEQPAGLVAAEACGVALPESTLAAIRRARVALKGPTTTPSGGGHVSANVQLRRTLDLFAAIRPIRSVPGVKTPYTDVDFVIVRENTEGLYAGQEMAISEGVVVSLKVVTEKATRRLARAAFAYAVAQGRKRVTVVHKANILKLGDGMFRRLVFEEAKAFPSIQCDEVLVDALCMRLVRDPRTFDVLVLENLYGDIVSDLGAGLVGGLGIVPGANIGEHAAVFEAVHGAAPDIAGQGLANPTALLKSAVLMLDHLNEGQAAKRLAAAIDSVFTAGQVKTRDLGGTASTQEFTDAVIAALRA
jgi:isocitrate dehydrogenase (NAD+)